MTRNYPDRTQWFYGTIKPFQDNYPANNLPFVPDYLNRFLLSIPKKEHIQDIIITLYYVRVMLSSILSYHENINDFTISPHWIARHSQRQSDK
jgi:hypothetical protein